MVGWLVILGAAIQVRFRCRFVGSQGALLRGVQLFNGRMLSRWRTEGFIDFAADAASGAVAAVPASEILRKLLALEGEDATSVVRA